MSDCRPIVLVTDYPPDAGGGGAVILRSLLAGPGREGILWASPCRAATSTTPAGPTVFLESGSAGRGSRRSLLRDSTIHARALAAEIADLADRHDARGLWLVLHGAVVPVAARLATAGRWPIHVTVHDDPAFANALRSSRYLALVPWIERACGRALRAARSVDVISRGMQQRYRHRFGVESVVIHRALDAPVEEVGDFDPGHDGLAIGVLGSTYAYGQLPILAAAVAAAAERLGVRGSVVVLGQSHGTRLRDAWGDRLHVEVLGHVAEAVAVGRLRRCLALYLNYPFGVRSRVLRQTSFPTKLSTYLQASRPLLIHSPTESSVAGLAAAGSAYAALWSTRSPKDGANHLVRLWQAATPPAALAAAAEGVRRRYFDPDRNRGQMARALAALGQTEPIPSAVAP